MANLIGRRVRDNADVHDATDVGAFADVVNRAVGHLSVRHGDQVPYIERNILPNEYYEVTGGDPVFIQALLYMALGFFIIVIIEKIALGISSRKK